MLLFMDRFWLILQISIFPQLQICIKHPWKGHTQWCQKVYSSHAMNIPAQSSVATWSPIKFSRTLQGCRNLPGLCRNKAVYYHLSPMLHGCYSTGTHVTCCWHSCGSRLVGSSLCHSTALLPHPPQHTPSVTCPGFWLSLGSMKADGT